MEFIETVLCIAGLILFIVALFAVGLFVTLVACDNCSERKDCETHADEDEFVPPCRRNDNFPPTHPFHINPN